MWSLSVGAIRLQHLLVVSRCSLAKCLISKQNMLVYMSHSQAFTSFYPDDLIHLFGFLHCCYTRILLLTCLVFFCTELWTWWCCSFCCFYVGIHNQPNTTLHLDPLSVALFCLLLSFLDRAVVSLLLLESYQRPEANSLYGSAYLTNKADSDEAQRTTTLAVTQKL